MGSTVIHEPLLQCAGKVRFESAALARKVARQRGRGGKGRKGNKPGVAYRCAHCGGWHIGRAKPHGGGR